MCVEQSVLWHNEQSPTDASQEPGFVNGDEAHIWYVDTEAMTASILRYYSYLSDKEKVRAERFHHLEEQHNYVLSQGIKRYILSSYVGSDPMGIKFEYNQHGKPFLSTSGTKITFSISHSGDVILLAVTRDTEVGIDVEYTDSAFEWRAIAQKFFSAAELQHLDSCPGDESRHFFSYWTQKEAILKAQGVGLFGLNVQAFEQRIRKPVDYTIIPFELAGHYQGSLAVNPRIQNVRFYAYTQVHTHL